MTDRESAPLPDQTEAAGQVDAHLPPPGGDQRVHGVDMDGEQLRAWAAGGERGTPEDAAPDRGGLASQAVGVEGAVGRGDLGADGLREVVERVRVVAEQAGRAGQGLAHARAELALEGREHLAPHPHAQERGVLVVGVVPRRELLRGAGRSGVLPGEVEQRHAVATLSLGHPGERPGAGASGKTQQHRLGLVVAGVAEEDDVRAALLGQPVERRVTRGPRSRLGTARRTDVDRDGEGLRTQGGHLLDDGLRLLRGTGLEAVVDGDPDDGVRGLAGLEDGRGEERQGVRAAGAGDQHARAGVEVREGAAHREPDRRDGGMGPHRRWVSRARGAPRRTGRRSRPSTGGSPGRPRPG